MSEEYFNKRMEDPEYARAYHEAVERFEQERAELAESDD